MTPQEKAIDLVNKFKYNTRAYSEDKQWEDTAYNAKQCALIAVDEILDLGLHSVGDYRNDQATIDDFSTVTWYINYWQEVKHEITQL
jgi:hypothetical protein